MKSSQVRRDKAWTFSIDVDLTHGMVSSGYDIPCICLAPTRKTAREIAEEVASHLFCSHGDNWISRAEFEELKSNDELGEERTEDDVCDSEESADEFIMDVRVRDLLEIPVAHFEVLRQYLSDRTPSRKARGAPSRPRQHVAAAVTHGLAVTDDP